MNSRLYSMIALMIGLPAVGVLVAGALGLAQPLPGSERPGGRDRQYAAWIPPGTYTAIVVCSSGQDRRWAVSLAKGSVSVPIVVRPGENVIIPFDQGWTVDPGHEARIESRLVPFDDASRFNLVGQAPDFVLSAWGITPTGPVQFVYREVK